MKKHKSDRRINEEVDAGRGKSSGWPKCLEYTLDNGTATVVLSRKGVKDNSRVMDSWGLAFFDHCRKESDVHPTELIFEVSGKVPCKELPKVEALKRRLSYLNWGDKVKTKLIVGGNDLPLYSRRELLNRPPVEVVRTDFAKRMANDEPGRLEKDFQAYLFGKGKRDDSRTNERLAILGEDFRDLNRKNYSFVMEREFPTGVFKGEKSEPARILPTGFIDVVSFNKWRELALIELKVNDSSLPVISQSMDYALFFASYQKQLWDLLKKKLNWTPKSKKFVLYIASNCFHRQFDCVAKYYTPEDKNVSFKIKKVVLGHTVLI